MSLKTAEYVTPTDDDQVDHTPKMETENSTPTPANNYKASANFLPNETSKTFKFKSVAEASRKFETESKTL